MCLCNTGSGVSMALIYHVLYSATLKLSNYQLQGRQRSCILLSVTLNQVFQYSIRSEFTIGIHKIIKSSKWNIDGMT